MKLDEVFSMAGAYRTRSRVGRGIGSGKGKTCGRGHKGMGARSGGGVRMNYEGGQTPMLARIPKRGFNNVQFRTEYQIVNVTSLECFEDGSRVDPPALEEARLIEDRDKPVKILGKGELTRKLTVVATKFSSSATEKITRVGGSVEQV